MKAVVLIEDGVFAARLVYDPTGTSVFVMCVNKTEDEDSPWEWVTLPKEHQRSIANCLTDLKCEGWCHMVLVEVDTEDDLVCESCFAKQS